MKKFISRIVMFLAAFLVYKFILTLYFYLSLPEKIDYTFSGKQLKRKPNLVFIGASNIEYNYNYERLAETFKSYNIITCHYTEPSGIFVTIEKSKSLGLGEKDIAVLCLPHSFYEPAKFLPLNRNSTLQRLTKTGFLNSMKFDFLTTLKNITVLSVTDIHRIHTYCTSNKKKTLEN